MNCPRSITLMPVSGPMACGTSSHLGPRRSGAGKDRVGPQLWGTRRWAVQVDLQEAPAPRTEVLPEDAAEAVGRRARQRDEIVEVGDPQHGPQLIGRVGWPQLGRALAAPPEDTALVL